ncbi:vitelline envelope sperm lysin receptor [Patella vulgata]|uniref:vitelline envelope sperm lysin receptor n=1 Tax=Patella vulgata TaxID=6465 RepID=UPI00218079C9|nr:vitelline envelope sperm lysin receptor [Patella vulgata]
MGVVYMPMISLVAVLLIIQYECVESIPHGFTVHVGGNCGVNLQSNSPMIKITSDLNIEAHAECVNGEKSFVSFDRVNYQLKGSFFSGSNFCVFKRRNNTNVYTVDIGIAYGESSNTLQRNVMKRTMTCTFDRTGIRQSSQHGLLKSLMSPVEVRGDAGKKTTSTLSLDLYDVSGSRITGAVRNGRTVYLAATADGRNKEVGIRPVTCKAISTSTRKSAEFLRAGCGVGIIFTHNVGFKTTGRQTRSPYFNIYQVNDDKYIAYECLFTLCFKNCDGSSCATRSKRSTGRDEETIVLRTKQTYLLE